MPIPTIQEIAGVLADPELRFTQQGKPVLSAAIIAGIALVVGFPSSLTWVTFGTALRRFLKSPRAL